MAQAVEQVGWLLVISRINYCTTREVSSENMGFYCANTGRYYMGQQLIAQLRQRAVNRRVKRSRINGGKLVLSLVYLSYNK